MFRVLGMYNFEVSTETLANTSPTGGSCGSDLNGPAVMDACQKVMARLEPYRTPQRQFFFYFNRLHILKNVHSHILLY